jgi:transposase
MRTIKRFSRPINQKKYNLIKTIVESFVNEKDDQLIAMGSPILFNQYKNQRQRRDYLVKQQYKSRYSLQARQWKMALKEAYETIDKQLLTISALLRSFIFQRKGTEEQKRYGFWLIQTSNRINSILSGKTLIPKHFDIPSKERRMVRNTLHRKMNLLNHSFPRVKIIRSFTLDQGMYEVFEHKGTQYIKIMGLVRGQRIVIPLTGKTPINGNIRIVLDHNLQRIEVHYTSKIKKPKPLKGESCGLDAGITEVFTDEQNNRYGIGFGKKIKLASDYQKNKGQKRNKLHQICKKTRNLTKKNNIKKFNLGYKKQTKIRKNTRIMIENTINQSINQVIKKRQPKRIVVEQLDFRGKSKSKILSRIVHFWMRRSLNERLEFIASVRGSYRKAVNPAYSSQRCTKCGYVDGKNRVGDMFQCKHCLHEDYADRIGAENLKVRDGDSEITLYTPKAQVKSLLLGRFNALLERAIAPIG